MSVKGYEPNRRGDVVRCGVLKKLKTARKKWFVLRAETPEASARLEYYDSEKKFNNGLPPKRSIPLKTCFNINRRHDTKYKHVIALYTKDDCFCVVLESEEDLDAWLKSLLSLQHGEEAMDGETPRPTFEHVWQVTLLNRGLGTICHLGPYRLCLTDKTLTLIKKDDNFVMELQLVNIRSCGSLRNFFFLEIGRSSNIGAGELWMESEDPNIAQNIHTTIFHAMSTNPRRAEELEPKSRVRSSSATESSKPSNVANKNKQGGTLKSNILNQGTLTRERCDSMPSRSRTASEGTHPIPRMMSVHNHGKDMSHSPHSGSPVSPPSVGSCADSVGSSYSIADEADSCLECGDPHSRYSIPLTPEEAIAEEDGIELGYSMQENFMPMLSHTDDGYMDMSRCHHNNTTSASASMSSVTSGTPSTDIRFSDYPLDKVSSYFAAEEDDARPARAYSVGSRPEAFRGKRHIELASTPENSRSRAFSVGSKISKRGPTRVLPPHHNHQGTKSNSAPLLSNHKNYSSHSSIGPMDDLMEMDFSRSNTGSSNVSSGYMEMKPSVPKTPSGYVEMKPGVDPNRSNSRNEVSPYVDMSGSSPARNYVTSPQEEYNSLVDMKQYHRLSSHEHVRNNNYVDMDHKKNRTHSTSSNTRVSSSPGSYPWGDYMDMSGNQPKRAERGSFSSQLSSSPNVVASVSPKNGDYMPINFQETRTTGNQPKTPDGYVEMTLGSKKHQRQSSLDNTQPSKGNEDYTNMSLGSGASKKSLLRKDKVRSQPITINTTTSNSQVTKNSSSPISISTILERKSSTGTPPRMHLPISSWNTSPYSSLPRQRTRKDSNSNSKDSSSSSLNTPSSSSTIFPMSLNSPCSPMKPISKTEVSSALKIPTAILSAIYKGSNKSKPKDDYTKMNFEPNKNKTGNKDESPSDYVNFLPAARTPIVRPSSMESMDETPGDYAIMRPGVIESKPVGTTGSTTGNTSPLVSHMSYMGLNESQAMCFRPIKDDGMLGNASPRAGDVLPIRISEDTRTRDAVAESTKPIYGSWRSLECVSPAAKISRPNSVNSDSTKSSSPRSSIPTNDKSRPPSVASDCSKGGATSRPSSTSSELCSSSSTVVGSRPDSVNSDHIRPDSAAGQPVTVKTDIQLHYARLDLAQAEEDGSRSPRTTKSSPSEATGSLATSEPVFFYAEIDFKKSEGMKVPPKVQH